MDKQQPRLATAVRGCVVNGNNAAKSLLKPVKKKTNQREDIDFVGDWAVTKMFKAIKPRRIHPTKATVR